MARSRKRLGQLQRCNSKRCNHEGHLAAQFDSALMKALAVCDPDGWPSRIDLAPSCPSSVRTGRLDAAVAQETGQPPQSHACHHLRAMLRPPSPGCVTTCRESFGSFYGTATVTCSSRRPSPRPDANHTPHPDLFMFGSGDQMQEPDGPPATRSGSPRSPKVDHI